jgi:hypothetical protein
VEEEIEEVPVVPSPSPKNELKRVKSVKMEMERRGEDCFFCNLGLGLKDSDPFQFLSRLGLPPRFSTSLAGAATN